MSERSALSTTVLADGAGWRAVDVVCRCAPGVEAEEERHDEVLVAAVLHGEFVYRSERGRTLLSPGSLLLGEVGRCYRCSHPLPGGDRCLAFRCDPAFVEEIAADLGGVRSVAFPDARLAPHRDLTPLFAAATDWMRTGDPERGEEIALAVVGAALRLSRAGTERAVSARDESRVAEALARIEAQGEDRLSLADLAADAQVTRHHFLRIFRRVVGVTPYAYLQTHRLRRAAAALAEGNRTVLDVALDCGFSDLSEFTRLFRRTFGRSPGAYGAARRGRRGIGETRDVSNA